MILGVDHVALSSRDLLQSANVLAGEGYEVRFVEDELVNAATKRPLLREYAQSHGIAWCAAPSGPAIELTAHQAPLHGATASFSGVLQRRPAAWRALSERSEALEPMLRAALGLSDPRACNWTEFNADVWYDAADATDAQGIRAVIAPVPDLAASEAFWTGTLRFTVVSRGDAGVRWARVALTAPVQSWGLDVVLAEIPRTDRFPPLDAPGFPCVAFLSNGVARDLERIRAAGAEGDPVEFTVVVNGRPLKICMIRAPGGQILELIELGGRESAGRLTQEKT